MDAPPFARDLDLIREVLLWAEKGGLPATKPKTDEARLAYHCHLLRQGGLIESAAVINQPGGGPCYVKMIGPPTLKGHDALQAIRDDTMWNTVKGKLTEHGIPAVFEVVVSLAKGLAQRSGLPMA